MRWFIDHYLGGADPLDPRISPIFATDRALAATCPAHVVIAGYDPLRDEGLAYAAAADRRRGGDRGPRYDGQMTASSPWATPCRPGRRPSRTPAPGCDRALGTGG